MKKFYRLGSPYDECQHGWDNKEFPVYSPFGATQECLENFARQNCNCSHGSLYIPEYPAPFCYNMSGPDIMTKCLKIYKELDIPNKCTQQMEACSETQYDVVTSQSEWPETQNIFLLIEKLVLNHGITLSNMNFLPKDLLNREEFISVPV